MRTTLSIDDDVLEAARVLAAARKASFRVIINEALRSGLSTLEGGMRSKAYRTEPRPMGVRPGYDLDNVQELLSRLEGEERR
jgi:hypothetical protein